MSDNVAASCDRGTSVGSGPLERSERRPVGTGTAMVRLGSSMLRTGTSVRISEAAENTWLVREAISEAMMADRDPAWDVISEINAGMSEIGSEAAVSKGANPGVGDAPTVIAGVTSVIPGRGKVTDGKAGWSDSPPPGVGIKLGTAGGSKPFPPGAGGF